MVKKKLNRVKKKLKERIKELKKVKNSNWLKRIKKWPNHILKKIQNG